MCLPRKNHKIKTLKSLSKTKNINTMDPLVLNPYEIGPTFLKLDLWLLGEGFISIINSNVLNHIKKERM